MPIKQRQIEMIDTTIQHSQDERPGAPLLASRRCSPTGNVYLYSLTAVASIGCFLFGYDTGVVSGAMALIRAAWNLNDVQHEAIVSSTTGLAAIGAMSSGTANRLFGRKPVLLAAAVVFTIGAVVMGIAQDFGQLLVGLTEEIFQTGCGAFARQGDVPVGEACRPSDTLVTQRGDSALGVTWEKTLAA